MGAEKRKDKAKRRFGFNVLDVLIVLAVLALLAVVILKSGIVESNVPGTSEKEFMFNVSIENVAKTSGGMLKPGDIIYDKDADRRAGEVVAVELSPAINVYDNHKGAYVSVESTDRIQMMVTVKAVGSRDDMGWYLNGQKHIAPGHFFNIRTSLYDVSGYVANVWEP